MSSVPLCIPSEGVGTDTPPQTPPNAKGNNSQGSVGQVSLLGGPAAGYMGSGGVTGPSSGYGPLGGPISCSRNPAIPMGQGNDAPMNPTSQRYPGTSGLPVGQPSHNSTNPSSMASTAFTPVYKTFVKCLYS